MAKDILLSIEKSAHRFSLSQNPCKKEKKKIYINAPQIHRDQDQLNYNKPTLLNSSQQVEQHVLPQHEYDPFKKWVRNINPKINITRQSLGQLASPVRNCCPNSCLHMPIQLSSSLATHGCSISISFSSFSHFISQEFLGLVCKNYENPCRLGQF